MQRIAIIGCCGAGKSTLARNLGAKLSLPVFHLDSYYWQPGWIETEAAEWIKIQQKLVNNNSWIIDGNYGDTIDIRAKASDTIIWLDFATIICIWRIITRYFQYQGKTRPDMSRDCPERISLKFLQYVANFSNQQKPKILTKLAQYQDSKQIIILKKPHQVKKFLKQ